MDDDDPVVLDERRGMAARKATEMRRPGAEVEAQRAALRSLEAGRLGSVFKTHDRSSWHGEHLWPPINGIRALATVNGGEIWEHPAE
jgi:hypothetical protein